MKSASPSSTPTSADFGEQYDAYIVLQLGQTLIVMTFQFLGSMGTNTPWSIHGPSYGF